LNFSFLSPIFLIGIAAVSLPVIAHLISRKSGFKKRFPALRFLLASQGEMATRSRLKDLILLLLRALIIVLIALLFAKPAVFSFSTADSSEPRSLALVIDNSFSMGYGENFKKAKKEAERLIDSTPDGSFFTALPLVPERGETISVIQDRDTARKSLNKISLSQTYTDNERRLEQVYSALEKTPNEEKQVVLLTDFQKNGWKREDYTRKWLTLIDVTETQAPGNRAVTDVESRYTKESIKVKLRVSNFSDSDTSDLLTEAELSGEKIKAYIDIAPRDFTTEEFIFPRTRTNEEPEASGSASIPEDELRLDDKRHFVLSRSGALNVLIVDGDPREDSRLSESYYLGSAAVTASELLRSRIRIKDNDSFLDEELSAYDLIFLTNVGEITPGKAKDLEGFIEQGGTAVIFPGDRVRAGSYNTLLQNILPGELGAPAQTDSTLVSVETDMFSEDLFDKISQARVNRSFTLIPAESSETILKLSDETPFLTYTSHGEGNVFLFTSTADTSWSNFAITPVFAPVIKELLDFESLSNTKRRNYIVGDSVAIDRPPAASSIEVKDPVGENYKIDPQEPVFSDTSRIGIYEVLIEGEEAYEFSVNLDPLESNLEKISRVSVESEPESELGLVKVFKELWRYFLWGVIALFISESVARALFS
jgi:aerotolerance regulator-like protein/VWA domain-containing protein